MFNQTIYCKINCTLEKLNLPSIKETDEIINNYYLQLEKFRNTYPELTNCPKLENLVKLCQKKKT